MSEVTMDELGPQLTNIFKQLADNNASQLTLVEEVKGINKMMSDVIKTNAVMTETINNLDISNEKFHQDIFKSVNTNWDMTRDIDKRIESCSNSININESSIKSLKAKAEKSAESIKELEITRYKMSGMWISIIGISLILSAVAAIVTILK